MHSCALAFDADQGIDDQFMRMNDNWFSRASDETTSVKAMSADVPMHAGREQGAVRVRLLSWAGRC